MKRKVFTCAVVPLLTLTKATRKMPDGCIDKSAENLQRPLENYGVQSRLRMR